MTSVIAAPVYEPRRGLPRSSAARAAVLERAHALLGADDAVDLDEHGRLGGVRRVVARRSGWGNASDRAARLGRHERAIVRGASARSASRSRVSTASVPSASPRASASSSTANEA